MTVKLKKRLAGLNKLRFLADFPIRKMITLYVHEAPYNLTRYPTLTPSKVFYHFMTLPKETLPEPSDLHNTLTSHPAPSQATLQ